MRVLEDIDKKSPGTEKKIIINKMIKKGVFFLVFSVILKELFKELEIR